MADVAKLILEGKEHELPIVTGSMGEKSVDITDLRAKTGYVTLDSGFGNTGAAESKITFIDGDKGILRYRGYPIEVLAEKSNFVETAYLLINGKLPTKTELDSFNTNMVRHSLIHEDMLRLFEGYPSSAHPMAILASMVCSLSSFYPDFLDVHNPEHVNNIVYRLLSKIRTIAAFSYKKSIGQPIMYPRNDLDYCSNFMYMMFAVPSEKYEVPEEFIKALDLLLILHADHEFNCSTSTVRMVGSSDANLFASSAAGICALWGAKHGGANQEVINMLKEIDKNGGDVDKAVAMAKDKDSNFRLFGFGHRIYKNYDPRAKVIKAACDNMLNKINRKDPLLEIARRLEDKALADPYFVERKLYPNVDFYSGIMYRAMGIPNDMFTVMFALGRMPGWIAHWMEMHQNKERIGRPRQIYQGKIQENYVPISDRG